jgi:hypothetical protein
MIFCNSSKRWNIKIRQYGTNPSICNESGQYIGNMRLCKHHSPLRHLFRATYVNDHWIHVTRKPFTVSKKPGGTVEPDYRTIRRFDIYCCTGTLYNLDINTIFLQFPFVYLCVTTTCVVSAYHYYSCEFESGVRHHKTFLCYGGYLNMENCI